MSEARSQRGRGPGGKVKRKSSLGWGDRSALVSPQTVGRPLEQPGPSSCLSSLWGTPNKQPCWALSQEAAVLPRKHPLYDTDDEGMAPIGVSSGLAREQQQELSSGATSVTMTQWSVAFSHGAFQELGVGPASLGHGRPSCSSNVGQEETVHKLSSQPIPPSSVPASSSLSVLSQRVTRLICQLIAVEGFPFSIVESVAFRRFLRYLFPGYEPPSCEKLCETVMPCLYRTTREFVKSQLARAWGRTVHFTSDIWTSQSERTYLLLTAHWWQPEDAVGGWQSSIREDEEAGHRAGYCQALLHAQVVDLEGAVASLSGVVEQQIEAWVGRDVARGFMVTDGGADVSAAVSDVSLRRIQCTAHLFHLVVNDALGLGSLEQAGWDAATRGLWRLLEDCRRIGAHFNCSVEATRLLQKKQEEAGVPDDHLIGDVATCWTTTYAMIERLLEQRSALHRVAEVADLVPGERPLSCVEWQTLSQTMLVLKLFKDSVEMLSRPTASLSLVAPKIQMLQEELATFSDPGQDGAQLLPLVAALVQRLQRGTDVHLRPLIQKPVYMLATLCDPRIKGTFALHDNVLPHWRDELTQRVRDFQAKRGTVAPAEAEEGSVLPYPSAGHSSCLEAEFVRCVVKGTVSKSKGHGKEDWAEVMVTEYLAEPRESSIADPLSYWAQREAVWPGLSLAAQELLSCPVTRVQSKQVFSDQATIPDPFPSMLEELAFLKVNLPLLDYGELAFESE